MRPELVRTAHSDSDDISESITGEQDDAQPFHLNAEEPQELDDPDQEQLLVQGRSDPEEERIGSAQAGGIGQEVVIVACQGDFRIVQSQRPQVAFSDPQPRVERIQGRQRTAGENVITDEEGCRAQRLP